VEGLIFYWISWTLWIYLTFILQKKNPYRLKLSVFILLLIITANVHFLVLGFEIYGGGLFLFITSLYMMGLEKRRTIVYYFICSCIMMMAYVSFHLFEIFDPVWVVFRKEWMMTIVLCVLSLLLQKSLKGRLLIIACGTIQGEAVYAYILSKYPFSYPVGAPEYLDIFMLIAAVLTGWSCLENAGPYFSQYFNLTGKGKPKSS
jgi:hypothetical protein